MNPQSYPVASELLPAERNADVESRTMGIELSDPEFARRDLFLKTIIVAALAVSFYIDLLYSASINITPIYIVVIFLTLSLQRVRWVLGVTAASLVLNLLTIRWHITHPYPNSHASAVFDHLLVAVGAQIPAGILAYRTLVSQRRLERGRQQALIRQRSLYERERAARAAEEEARRREAQASEELRAHAAELTRIIESERDARRREQEARRREQQARGERDHLRQLTEEFQRALLSEVPHEVGGHSLAIGSLYQPAIQEMQMGGDFYDAITLPNGKIGLVIGDVAGHGVEAAAQTALVTTLLRAFAVESPDSAARVLNRVNRALTLDRQFRSFVTLCYAVYDPAGGSLRYVNAGHEPPLVLRANGESDILESLGLVVGVDADVIYPDRELSLCAGDCLIMFTDGITEARRPGSVDLLGWEGVAEIARRYRDQAMRRGADWASSYAAADLADTLYHEALAFAGGDADGSTGLNDDVALLIVMALADCG